MLLLRLKCLNHAPVARQFPKLHLQLQRRHALSTLPPPKIVPVRTGMAGHVNISLYNISEDRPRDPVLIFLPPLGDTPTNFPIPTYLRDLPLAVIHYRWSGKVQSFGAVNSAMHWPTPIFDVSFAWEWLAENLKPLGEYARRDFYVFGAHLGAPLALTLAMTNCRPHVGVAIRGVAAFDGIYDWTRFLPDHWDNKWKKYVNKHGEAIRLPETLKKLKRSLPALFKMPENLFDSAASPYLFFATSGLRVPQSFNKTIRDEYQERHIPMLAENEMESFERLQKEYTELQGCIDISHDEKRYDLAPDPGDVSHILRRLSVVREAPMPVHLNFPTWESHLALPETLLMYTASAAERTGPDGAPDNTIHGHEVYVAPPTAPLTPCDVDPNAVVYGPHPEPEPASWRLRQPLALPHTFKTQAVVLGNAMVRSLQWFEVKPRSKWGEPWFRVYMSRLRKRITAVDVGECEELMPTDKGVEVLIEWLRLRMQPPTEIVEDSVADDEGQMAIDEMALMDAEMQNALEEVAGRGYWNIHSVDEIYNAEQPEHGDPEIERLGDFDLDQYPGDIEYEQLDDSDSTIE